MKLIKMFVTSPVVLFIALGLVLNFLGIPERIESIPFTSGLLGAVELLGSLTVPLILIVMGYGIKLDKQEFAYSARVILIRLLILIPVALLLNRFVDDGLMVLDAGFKAGVFTLLILPPLHPDSLHEARPGRRDTLRRQYPNALYHRDNHHFHDLLRSESNDMIAGNAAQV